MESQAKRTLVKSAPELWELADDLMRMEAWMAGLVGHAEIYVSGGAEHQGPDGGGPVAVIVDRARS